MWDIAHLLPRGPVGILRLARCKREQNCRESREGECFEIHCAFLLISSAISVETRSMAAIQALSAAIIQIKADRRTRLGRASVLVIRLPPHALGLGQ
jgi:hypothetical protein